MVCALHNEHVCISALLLNNVWCAVPGAASDYQRADRGHAGPQPLARADSLESLLPLDSSGPWSPSPPVPHARKSIVKHSRTPSDSLSSDAVPVSVMGLGSLSPDVRPAAPYSAEAGPSVLKSPTGSKAGRSKHVIFRTPAPEDDERLDISAAATALFHTSAAGGSVERSGLGDQMRSKVREFHDAVEEARRYACRSVWLD